MSSCKDIIDECSAILLDIEGTTTSISFVKDVLFPYVRKHLHDYILRKWDEAEFQDDLKALQRQCDYDAENNIEHVTIPKFCDKFKMQNAVLENVFKQMDSDRKTTALKQLQGHMWKEAYHSKEIFGHIYDDVQPAFRYWIGLCKKIFIYSSGSIEAQKLLFEYSIKGNLLENITGHFDTTTGFKTNSSSYEKIANHIGLPAKKIAFFTDVFKEAKAAAECGMVAVLVVREGNQPLSKEDKENFPVIYSFAEITQTF